MLFVLTTFIFRDRTVHFSKWQTMVALSTLSSTKHLAVHLEHELPEQAIIISSFNSNTPTTVKDREYSIVFLI